jgi:hypothetical protein
LKRGNNKGFPEKLYNIFLIGLEGDTLKKMLSQLSLTATILFVVTLVISLLYPEVLKVLFLTQMEARSIILTLISLILLLSFLQSQLSLSWRIFCLITSFIVLIESILMLGAWQRIIR